MIHQEVLGPIPVQAFLSGACVGFLQIPKTCTLSRLETLKCPQVWIVSWMWCVQEVFRSTPQHPLKPWWRLMENVPMAVSLSLLQSVFAILYWESNLSFLSLMRNKELVLTKHRKMAARFLGLSYSSICWYHLCTTRGAPVARKALCATAVRCSSSSGRFGCAPLCAPLFTWDHVFQMCICVFVVLGVCHVFRMSCLSGCFACEERCKEAHLDGYLNGCFHLGGRAQIKVTLHNKGKQNKKNMHSSRGNMLTASAGTNLCALITLKLRKRRLRALWSISAVPKGHRRKQKSDLLSYLY